jgi:hypothetical protein
MRHVIRIALLLLVALLALPADSAFAQRRGGWHHHRHTVFVGSAFYFGPPMWYGYHYPPYYYGPLYEATETAPAMYIEKFEGRPDANSGDIFCPASGVYYPDAQECPNGWQRIIHPPATGSG